MTIKGFFITTAALEVGAGLALTLFPLQAVSLLLGSGGAGFANVPICQIGGCALVALALINWLTRNDAQSNTAQGVVAGMTIYNLGAVIVLGLFGLNSHDVGWLLWPAVILHIFMSMWCGWCLAKKLV